MCCHTETAGVSAGRMILTPTQPVVLYLLSYPPPLKNPKKTPLKTNKKAKKQKQKQQQQQQQKNNEKKKQQQTKGNKEKNKCVSRFHAMLKNVFLGILYVRQWKGDTTRKGLRLFIHNDTMKPPKKPS